MTAAERAEQEYQRGRDLASRGNLSAAQLRFKRATAGGVDVAGRLEEEGFGEPQKVNARTQEDDSRQKTLDMLRDAKAKDHGKPLPNTTPDSPIRKDPLVIPETKKKDIAIDDALSTQTGGGPSGGGYWKSVTDCDDVTFEVWTKL